MCVSLWMCVGPCVYVSLCVCPVCACVPVCVHACPCACVCPCVLMTLRVHMCASPKRLHGWGGAGLEPECVTSPACVRQGCWA